MPDEPEVQDNDEESSVIRTLRVKAEKADAAEARVAELERKLVVHEAGLSSLTQKQINALITNVEGDLTADALKAQAQEFGWSAKPQAPEGEKPEVPNALQAEFDAMGRADDLSGSEPVVTPTEEAFLSAIKGASSPEDLDKLLGPTGIIAVD